MAFNNDNGVDQHTVLPAYHVPLPSTESKSQENKVVEDDTVDVVYKEQEQSESDGREPGRLENKAADVKGKIEQFLSWRYMRAPVLIFTACLIFGWWIAGLFTMRHRWYVMSIEKERNANDAPRIVQTVWGEYRA